MRAKNYGGAFGRVQRELGAVLTGARHENGVTQDALARFSGIAQSDVSRMENGICNPTLRTLHRIADALSCRLVISLERKK